ncbi:MULTISPECIES: hypothetical protein [Roseateles]|uniref:Uncharacterized protein n=1 Tax=Roseateles albus TaxID=2987525 RepID=A0ABT5KIU5_9BURK|nr:MULTISPECIES: hypothetical protein [Roseateles]MDC8772860.1 hypothetical protein [Roseateles albus]
MMDCPCAMLGDASGELALAGFAEDAASLIRTLPASSFEPGGL